MAEAHTPGERVLRSPLDDRMLVDTVNGIRESDDETVVARELLRLHHGLTVECRPVLDQLVVRAHPAGRRRTLCEAPVEEQLDRLYVTVLVELGDAHFAYADARFLEERLQLRAAQHLGDILTDLAHDAVVTEGRAFATIADRDGVVDLLRSRRLSPASLLLHACEVFDLDVARWCGPMPNPVLAEIPDVMRLVGALDDHQLSRLIDESRRSLFALGRLGDTERYRTMIVSWARDRRRRARRPGTGFLTVAELAPLFPFLRSLKVKVSQGHGRLADLRVAPGASGLVAAPGPATPLRSLDWGAGGALIEAAHRAD